MRYKIIRTDNLDDEITNQTFDNFSDAYDLLKKIYGDMCCSDVDYQDGPYYNIINIEKNDSDLKIVNY